MTHKLDPLGDGISSLELVRASGSDLDAVNAARVSYGGFKTELDERDKKLIHYLIKHDHTSPFEHNQLMFRVRAPIFVVRDWVRHRVGVSYNEISGRYTTIPLDFYTPKKWRTQDPLNKQSSVPTNFENEQEISETYKKVIDQVKESYTALLKAGVCNELARGILPVCIYSEFIFTCNLISLFHFVKLRAASSAQWEIQQYAKGMLFLANPHFETSIQAWKEYKNISDESLIMAMHKTEASPSEAM
jgi:thymidylate synthase (FAD)